MMRLLALALLVTSCKHGGGGESDEVAEESKPAGNTRGSEGGFSASLSADLEVRGPTAKAGSAGSAGSDFFDAVAGSATKPLPPAVGSATPPSATPPASGSATAGTTESQLAKNPPLPVLDPGAKGSAAKPAAGSAKAEAEIEMPAVTPPKPPIVMTAELKAIKLSLLPNWERDAVDPATISLSVTVQSRDVKELFKFSYGYEDPKAPTDREEFKKYLSAAKIMTVITDRQRGAAWYLEGKNGAGLMQFRLIVNYGGRRLYCGGSAYHDNALGDIRDEVVMQAKKICETVTL